MNALRFCLALTVLFTPLLPAAAQQPPAAVEEVRVVTSEGAFTLRLDARRAPLTVRNFLSYVDSGHYEGTIFHRVIPGFMAQGGGYDADLAEKPTREAVVNESGNGLSNLRGTIAMARTNDPHSATAQFFISLVDNQKLDPNPARWGYTVFGRVTEGMEVLDAIAQIETGPKGIFRRDVPKTTITIESMTRSTGAAPARRKPPAGKDKR